MDAFLEAYVEPAAAVVPLAELAEDVRQQIFRDLPAKGRSKLTPAEVQEELQRRQLG